MESRHEICVSLDKLTLQMLCLMEDKVHSQINIENATKLGSIHIAKSRYIMGMQTVSNLQLPTENTMEFLALSTTEAKKGYNNGNEIIQYSLDFKECIPNSMYVNPLKWFGVLVPQSLHQAQNIFKSALEYIIESVNIQNQLDSVCNAISELMISKEKLSPEI